MASFLKTLKCLYFVSIAPSFGGSDQNLILDITQNSSKGISVLIPKIPKPSFIGVNCICFADLTQKMYKLIFVGTSENDIGNSAWAAAPCVVQHQPRSE